MSSANHQHTSFEISDQLIQWEEEARAVIADVKNHVRNIFISETLPSNGREIYLNCETLEEEKYTIRMSSNGFEAVGKHFDCVDQLTSAIAYETPYALLNVISPCYAKSFGDDLTKALQNLI